MSKLKEKLNDLQKNTVFELFEDKSITNKSIDVPLLFNSIYNIKYSYTFLKNQYVQILSKNKSVVIKDNTENNLVDKNIINLPVSNDDNNLKCRKRKLQTFYNEQLIKRNKNLIINNTEFIINDTELEINFKEFMSNIFINNKLVVNYYKYLDYFINQFHLKKISVQGDGLCFINCLILYHKYCLNKSLTIDEIKDIYYNHFVDNPIITFNYLDYHNELQYKLHDYFENKNYNSDIYDYIINVTPEIFKLNMFIFNLQNNYISTINKMTHNSIVTNKSIYLVRENLVNNKGT